MSSVIPGVEEVKTETGQIVAFLHTQKDSQGNPLVPESVLDDVYYLMLSAWTNNNHKQWQLMREGCSVVVVKLPETKDIVYMDLKTDFLCKRSYNFSALNLYDHWIIPYVLPKLIRRLSTHSPDLPMVEDMLRDFRHTIDQRDDMFGKQARYIVPALNNVFDAMVSGGHTDLLKRWVEIYCEPNSCYSWRLTYMDQVKNEAVWKLRPQNELSHWLRHGPRTVTYNTVLLWDELSTEQRQILELVLVKRPEEENTYFCLAEAVESKVRKALQQVFQALGMVEVGNKK
jgi:hypothetical protein